LFKLLTQKISPLGGRQIIKNNLNCFAKNSANNYKRISILLLIGLALILRIHHLDHESLWMDEIRQTSYYDNSLTDIIDNSASQSQPPLDYWIGHFVHFLSSGDFAERLPAALFGAGSVFVLVMLISQISSWPVACGFGIISAFLPFNLCYSQEARPYAIAIFLFLCIFWILNNFLSIYRKKKLVPVLALLFFSTIFLYSRSLSPLVVTVSLLLILIIWLFFLILKADPRATEKKYLIMLSCGTLILALVLYLPAFRFILAKSGRSVSDTSFGIPIDKILSTVINLDMSPIWQAYVVQSEPITYPLLALVCLSPFLGWKMYLHRKNSLWVITSFLLPLACILNLIIFQSKSNMPFRPSYASYILPLACILGAVSIQGLWTLSVKVPFVYISRSFLLILAALFTFQTLMSAIDYKTMRRKTDWRGVTAFLTEDYDARHLLIFDSFTRYGSWEPTFYGFPRYYHGRSPFASINQIPLHAPKMARLSLTPILILFQWHGYYLTPQSTYPIHTVLSPGQASIDYKKICRDPGLICTEFTGFSLIQLRKKSNNLARDTYDIIEILLSQSPKGSWNVGHHLAAAALARAIQLDQWHYHLRQAENMTHPKHLPRVKNIAKFIRTSDRQ
jgi:hypothetical protein